MKSGDLNLCLEKFMMLGSDGGGGGDGGGGDMKKVQGGFVLNEWKDIPMELLLRIVSVVDDHWSVIAVAGVCSGWRESLSLGLTHLNLSWCKKNMNVLVLALTPKFTKLQTLTLRQSTPQLEDNAVEAIATYCHDLQNLDLSKSFKLSDRSLYALAKGCPNLSKLNISGCITFSDVSLAYLTKFCRKLKVLNLCGCVKAASDRALEAMADNCRQLLSLNLGWCESVTDKGVTCLAFGCPDLRAIDLCGCVRITDESVIALANGCHRLRSLDLYYCQNITDRAMYSLAQSQVKNKQKMRKHLKNKYCDEGLMNLNISQCTALTPHAVQAVCDSFPALHTCPGRHSLIISGCLNLVSVRCACTVQARRLAHTLNALNRMH